MCDGPDLLRELAHATEHSVPAPSMMVLNFPSNPTAKVVDKKFYEEAVKFAKARDVFILSDIAFSEIGLNSAALDPGSRGSP